MLEKRGANGHFLKTLEIAQPLQAAPLDQAALCFASTLDLVTPSRLGLESRYDNQCFRFAFSSVAHVSYAIRSENLRTQPPASAGDTLSSMLARGTARTLAVVNSRLRRPRTILAHAHIRLCDLHVPLSRFLAPPTPCPVPVSASTSTHPRLRAPLVPPPVNFGLNLRVEACLGSVSEPRALVVARCVGIGDDGCAAQRREDEEHTTTSRVLLVGCYREAGESKDMSLAVGSTSASPRDRVPISLSLSPRPTGIRFGSTWGSDPARLTSSTRRRRRWRRAPSPFAGTFRSPRECCTASHSMHGHVAFVFRVPPILPFDLAVDISFVFTLAFTLAFTLDIESRFRLLSMSTSPPHTSVILATNIAAPAASQPPLAQPTHHPTLHSVTSVRTHCQWALN
ncbi:hypothetical protein B0H14DRAFT_3861207 [Mycena olivaceomarginata]|nr:hypothetical protein B0H14DRAFT_3861207 [Mycena olivaceomarginata]